MGIPDDYHDSVLEAALADFSNCNRGVEIVVETRRARLSGGIFEPEVSQVFDPQSVQGLLSASFL